MAGLSQTNSHAQQARFSPADVGQTVNGYQDDFDGSVRNPKWVAHGPGGDLFVQDNGVLRVTASGGDPNHLLYEAPGYNDAAQEVLARIKVNSFGTGGGPRGGISVGISPDSSQGINLMFRDWSDQVIDGVTRHFRLLDDFRAWGPGFGVEWKENTWYWLRLRQAASSAAGENNIQAKVWLAEATVTVDVTLPTVVSVASGITFDHLTVVFSEPVTESSASNVANYGISGLAISDASLSSGGTKVELQTGKQNPLANYTLTPKEIQDLVGNKIAPNTQVPINLAMGVPAELGQTVNGVQDDFSGAVRDPNWVAFGPAGDIYEQANGVLNVKAATGDPNHLLYTAAGYDDADQEVLARIKINAFGNGDYPRGGIGVGVNPENSQGIELHFRNSDFSQNGTRFRLLDDLRAWGPALQTNWATNVWFWLRLRQTGSTTAGGDNIKAKVWLGDGTVPEPSDWQANWNRSGRTGLAGITGSSGGGNEEFEVDYILIKADGLPSVNVAAAAFSLVGAAPAVAKFSGFTRTTGNRILLEWIGTGSLEQADRITGPWTVVTGASSPLTVTVSGTAKSHRRVYSGEA